MKHALALVLAAVLGGAGCSPEASSAPMPQGAQAAANAKAQPQAVTPAANPPAAAPNANANANAEAVPARPAYEAVLIKDVPHVCQKTDFCGEACAEMFLKHLGKGWTQDDVFNASGVDPLLARGCYTQELAAALKAVGLRPGTVGRPVAAKRAAEEMEAQWQDLYQDLARGIPSIVCMHYDKSPTTTEHFRLVLGYDPAGDQVLYNEPAEADGGYRKMARQDFLALWPLKYDKDAWTVIRMRLDAGGTIGKPPARVGFTAADYAQHAMILKKKVPAKGFSLVLSPPFVVIAEGTPADAKLYAERTVQWAADALKKDFFAKDPDDILDIWLFKDEVSFPKYAKEIFGDKPTTPYGYFSAQHGALVMNIGTGGGTLVHEIVHPYMRANFADCPDWFNEGMGSLYEQSANRSGHIVGLTNWRLAGLQRAIAAKSLPTFKALLSTTNAQFYNDDTKGTHYAQARYLCYYLQEKGLLVKFYQDFLKNRKDDPAGYKTLQKMLGEDDMAAFQTRWEEWVMKLRFPS
jgi:hypothetical protein